MNTAEGHKEIRSLRSRRDEAARHLGRTQKQQDEMQAFIPAISQAIVMELSDFIERLNAEIDELEGMYTPCDRQHYIQQAFSFLCDCAIQDNEIPF